MRDGYAEPRPHVHEPDEARAQLLLRPLDIRAQDAFICLKCLGMGSAPLDFPRQHVGSHQRQSRALAREWRRAVRRIAQQDQPAF
ncbi:hypothetical protein D3C81_2102320 [compost metagenome]